MAAGKIDNSFIGAAGVHFVAFELSRRGMIALPTIRNTPGYDIIVSSPDGRKHANIQVKASGSRVGFFPMPAADRVCAGEDDYYVLLRWLDKERTFETFMLTGREAKQAVQAAYSELLERKPDARPEAIIQQVKMGNPEQTGAWKKRWDNWSL